MGCRTKVATCLVAGLLGSGGVQAAQYSITPVGSFGGTYGAAYGINDKGQVVGFSTTQGNQDQRPFLFSAGSLIDLGSFGGTSSAAYQINSGGQIVGLSSLPGNNSSHAFLYELGTLTDLGSLGRSSAAFAINESGLIGGTADISPFMSHAMLYTNGLMADVGSLGGSSGAIFGLNNHGSGVGYSFVTGQSLPLHALLYSNGQMTDLGTLGGPNSGASGINDLEQIVGWASLDPTVTHAFTYANGVMTDLGTLHGYSSFAMAINDVGQIVGAIEGLGGYFRRAFIYEDGAMTDLNDLVEPGSDWEIRGANDINRYGQIAATGCNSRGVCQGLLLTPIHEAPEPLSLALDGIGLAGIAASRRNDSAGPERKANPTPRAAG